MKEIGRIAATLLVIAACSDSTSPIDVQAPSGLFYVLEPSGNPQDPAGVLLRWDPVTELDLDAYRIYSRTSTSVDFDLRATTTSASFHDLGNPEIEYFVTALYFDGVESAASNVVFIDERLRLSRPAAINSISLDGAILVTWQDNSFLDAPDGFDRYRVYSTLFSLDENLCADAWALEGTTVSPEFLISALVNGQPRCFAVSAVSIEGFESSWSDLIADTPRPDARNVFMTPIEVDPNFAGFRFFQDANGDGLVGGLELGIVTSGMRSDVDIRFFMDPNGDVFIEPIRTGVEVGLYSSARVADLTSIDIAPEAGFDVTPIQAVTGFGYVVQIAEADGFFRYGAIHMTHVGTDYVIFDWSYQTDPGNPELSVHGGQTFSDGRPLKVRR